MAQPVNGIDKKFSFLSCWMIAAWMFTSFAYAEVLPDPMRPYSAAPQAEGAMPTAVSGPVLQSIMIAPDRKTAIISGQTVTVGQSFGSAKVTRITETEVTLKRDGEVQVLRLFSGLEKRQSIAPVIQGTSDRLNQVRMQ